MCKTGETTVFEQSKKIVDFLVLCHLVRLFEENGQDIGMSQGRFLAFEFLRVVGELVVFVGVGEVRFGEKVEGGVGEGAKEAVAGAVDLEVGWGLFLGL